MTDVFTKFAQRCPFCGRAKDVTASHFVPRTVVDCRCGAVLEIRPIRQTPDAKFWACEWEDR